MLKSEKYLNNKSELEPTALLLQFTVTRDQLDEK